MLKPQKIKDQEFPIKLRGYDPIEVKNYLEILADEFFELTERNRVLQEELDTLKLNTLASAEHKGTMYDMGDSGAENGVPVHPLNSDRSDNSSIAEERDPHEAVERGIFESRIASLTNDNIVYLTRIKDLNAKLVQEQAKNEALLEENGILQKEEASFKKTILAAQTFADNLKKSAEEEAARMLENAKENVDDYLLEMDKKAEYLPELIADLEKRKDDVRFELKAVLDGYLAVLDLEELSEEESEDGA